MIKFPSWVVLPKRAPKNDQALKVLRYLVIRASFATSASANVADFATAIGLDRTTIHSYMKKGKFSIRAARAAEAHYGPELIKADWLINPLELLKVK